MNAVLPGGDNNGGRVGIQARLERARVVRDPVPPASEQDASDLLCSETTVYYPGDGDVSIDVQCVFGALSWNKSYSDIPLDNTDRPICNIIGDETPIYVSVFIYEGDEKLRKTPHHDVVPR